MTEAKTSVQSETPNVQIKEKSLLEAYLLFIPLGLFGAHHFYLKRPGWGCLYLFTLGLLGVGYVVDLFRMPWLVKRANKDIAERGQGKIHLKYVGDAYLAWFPMGLVGTHHFYLRNFGWGFAYLFTFGFLGIGWVLDGIVMCSMVKEHNNQFTAPQEHRDKAKRLSTAYRFWTFPVTGWLGVHHYYMGRTAYGLFYTFTIGGLGVGWICDLFRMPLLMKDAKTRKVEGRSFKERRLDDCYIMMIPFGLCGVHHFYLHRVGWGFLYLFTFGCFGIGWLVDFFRLPRLVKQHNEELRRKYIKEQGHEEGVVCGIDNHGAAHTGSSGEPNVHSGTVLPPGTVLPHGSCMDEATICGVYSVPQIYPGYPGILGPSAPQQGYSEKADEAAGIPPYPLAPPDYEQSGMSNFSTIESSNANGLPSYEDAILENISNQETAATAESYNTPTAPPIRKQFI